MSTPTAEDTPIFDTCRCDDDSALQLMRDLVTAGVPQWDASLIAFSRELPTTATARSWTAWARIEARRIANRARVALGLPELPVTEVI